MPLVVHFLSNSAWKPSQEPLLEAAYILTGDQNDYVFFFCEVTWLSELIQSQ